MNRDYAPKHLKNATDEELRAHYRGIRAMVKKPTGLGAMSKEDALKIQKMGGKMRWAKRNEKAIKQKPQKKS